MWERSALGPAPLSVRAGNMTRFRLIYHKLLLLGGKLLVVGLDGGVADAEAGCQYGTHMTI
jgi:hypothetical protein